MMVYLACLLPSVQYLSVLDIMSVAFTLDWVYRMAVCPSCFINALADTDGPASSGGRARIVAVRPSLCACLYVVSRGARGTRGPLGSWQGRGVRSPVTGTTHERETPSHPALHPRLPFYRLQCPLLCAIVPNSVYFHLAMICLGINLCIGLYLTVYLQLIKGINIEWATYCPRMIPAATFSGVVCAIW